MLRTNRSAIVARLQSTLVIARAKSLAGLFESGRPVLIAPPVLAPVIRIVLDIWGLLLGLGGSGLFRQLAC
jgi:hypothetical protein